MIRHIVLFRFDGTDEGALSASVDTLSGALLPLLGSVDGLESLRVDADGSGIGTHWHAALVTEHPTWEDLAAYQAHPDHQAAVTLINPVVVDRAVVDYEL